MTQTDQVTALLSEFAGLAADIDELRALRLELAGDTKLRRMISDTIGYTADVRDAIRLIHEHVAEITIPEPVDPDTPPVYGVGFKGGRYAA